MKLRLAILDVVMPGRSGRAVFETIREGRPDLPVIFATGYSFSALDPHSLPDEGYTVIQKPFGTRDLLARVREAIDAA